MSLQCCEKSYVSYRPYCVGWRKYLNCSYGITRCRHTDIYVLYSYAPDFAIWGVWSKVKATYEILFLFNCKYHTVWPAKAGILIIGGTYTPFCIRMTSLFFKVTVHSSRSHVKQCCSFKKRYNMNSLVRAAKLDTHFYLQSRNKFIFCQGRWSKLKSTVQIRLLSEHDYTL